MGGICRGVKEATRELTFRNRPLQSLLRSSLSVRFDEQSMGGRSFPYLQVFLMSPRCQGSGSVVSSNFESELECIKVNCLIKRSKYKGPCA